MPPSPTHNGPPRTPARKASTSALLSGYWEKLTGSLTRSGVASPPPPTTTQTPVEVVFSGADWSAGGRTADGALRIDGVGASRDPNDDETAREDASIQPASFAAVVGGPPGLVQLLQQARHDRPVHERVTAVRAIAKIVTDYPVQGLLGIWVTAGDLIRSPDTDARGAGFELFRSCVASKNLKGVERQTFFNAIRRAQNDTNRSLCFDVLYTLTRAGKDVEDIWADLPEHLGQTLTAAFEAVDLARRKHKDSGKKQKAQAAVLEEVLFTDLLRYVSDVTKYNSKLLKDAHTERLIARMVAICKRTTSEADLKGCLDLVETLITYTNVPLTAVQPCVELFAGIYKQLEPLRKRTWTLMKDIFRSHLGPAAINVLLTSLRSAGAADVPDSCVRGAFMLLSKLIQRKDKPGTPSVSLELFVEACRSSLVVRSAGYHAEVVSFFSGMLLSDTLSEQLLEEANWAEFMSLILEAGNASQLFQTPSLKRMMSDDSQTALPTRSDTPSSSLHAVKLREALTDFAERLTLLFPRMDLVQKASTVDYFFYLGSYLGATPLQALLDHYDEERLLWLSNTGWLNACRFFIDRLFKDMSRPSHMRVRMVQMLRDVYDTASCIRQDPDADELAIMVLEDAAIDSDILVLEALGDFALQVVEHGSSDLCHRTLDIITGAILERKESSKDNSSRYALSTLPVATTSDLPPPGSPSNVLTSFVVRMFLRTLHTSSEKASRLYDLLRVIAWANSSAVDARVTALKLLFRLRADAHNALYVMELSEGEEMAAVLCRTADTAAAPTTVYDNPVVRPSRSQTQSAPAEHCLPAYRQGGAQTDRRAAPLWMYPGPQGLPEAPDQSSSRILTSGQGTSPHTSVLTMRDWLNLVIIILKEDVDWEIYSYCLVHLGSQLVNHSLFIDAVPQILTLRSTICEQLRNSSFKEPPAYTSLRKSDVAVCLYHILTMLISYHGHFNKNDEDEIVRVFVLGIGTGETTTNWCIHALALACHELGPSVSKSLETILQKMSQIITQSKVQMHVLEFIGGLCRMPELYKNFREEDYKMVFGICSRFLQTSRDDRDKRKAPSPQPPRINQGLLRHSAGLRDLHASSETAAKKSQHANTLDLPQYVYALAHHVICFWFLAVKLQDRPKYLALITRNLTYTEASGSGEQQVVEEQGIVTIDMMQRVAYTDNDDTVRQENFAKAADGEIVKKTWVFGTSLLTIETASRTGLSQVTIRRPSATKYSIFRPAATQPPHHQTGPVSGVDSSSQYNQHDNRVLPDHILQEFYTPFANAALPYTIPLQPIVLPDDETTRRAISTFDRNMTVDSHKVGVIYIGERQTSEAEIFANVMGSADYTNFVMRLGSLVRLKGATFNTQGLDREFDTDGEFTIAVRDRVAELIFHVTTMMPTNLEHDPQGTAKKRHTGNDYVNIVWNNSGTAFRFDTFPSAFNFVYIVITPTARASFVDTRTAETNGSAVPEAAAEVRSVTSSAGLSAGASSFKTSHDAPSSRSHTTAHRFYRVHVHSAPGFPAISPASRPKIVSAEALPDFVRLLALNASVFSLVWANREGGEHISSWRNRLREINRLRDKHSRSRPVSPERAMAGSSPLSRPPSTPSLSPDNRGSMLSNVSGVLGLAGGERRTAQHAMRDSGAAFKRVSGYTALSDDTASRVSLVSSADGADSDRKASH